MYLDYTGAGVYAESQLREHMGLLESGVFGNPHSINPTSAASTELVERARALAAGVLQRLTGGVRRDLHPERDRRGCGSSVRRTRSHPGTGSC